MAHITDTLIDEAASLVITTRDFCGNEAEAIREIAAENNVADWRKLSVSPSSAPTPNGMASRRPPASTPSTSSEIGLPVEAIRRGGERPPLHRNESRTNEHHRPINLQAL